MDMAFYRIMASVIAMIAAVTGSRACGQDLLPGRANIAGGRLQQDFTSDGIRFGSWLVAPQVQARAGYDSNLFGTETNRTGTAYVIMAPSLRLQSDWGQKGVAVSANGNLTRYVDHPEQNSNEYAVRGGGKFAMGGVEVQLAASTAQTAERRGTNGTPLSIGPPSLFRSVAQSFNLKRETGPLSITAGVSHETLRYNDLLAPNGRVITQRFRNLESWSANGRVTFLPSDIAGLSVFSSYEQATVPFPNNFDNITTTFGGAAAIDVGMARVAGELGRVKRDFGNPAFRDFKGWTYNGGVDWYPTPLLAIGVHANRALESSGVPTVGNIVTRSYAINVDYELLRNFLVQGRVAWRRVQFPEIDQSARSIVREIKGEFSFNQFVAIGVYGRLECDNSSVTGTARHYCVNLGGITLTLRH